MKILHLIPYYVRANKTGGPALLLSRLGQTLQMHGNEVQIVTTTGNLDEEIDLLFDGDTFAIQEQELPTIYLRRQKSFYPPTYYYAPSLPSWLKANIHQFEIVVIHGTWTYFSWMGARMCQKLGKPYLFFVHGSFDPWALDYHRAKKIPYWHLLEKPNFHKANGVIVLSHDEAAQVQAMGVEKPMFIARNGLLYPMPRVANPDHFLRIRLPTLGACPFVLFMSRLHPKKGLEVLLEAWKGIVSRYPEWRLVIAGPDEGGYLQKLHFRVHELNLRESVLFPGLVMNDDKAALLQRASLFVLPSLSEGVPGAVVEATAYGVPVLITPGCHMPEVVDAQAGLIVEPKPEAVAAGLERLISDNALRQKMGRNAEHLARDKFDIVKVANELVDFCQSLLDRSVEIA